MCTTIVAVSGKMFFKKAIFRLCCSLLFVKYGENSECESCASSFPCLESPTDMGTHCERGWRLVLNGGCSKLGEVKAQSILRPKNACGGEPLLYFCINIPSCVLVGITLCVLSCGMRTPLVLLLIQRFLVM